MVQGEQFFNRSDCNDLMVGQYRNPVANRPQRIEVVGDQENGQLQLFLQPFDQLVLRGFAAEGGGNMW